MNKNIYGLILAGGKSRRMGKEKAVLTYEKDGLEQWRKLYELLHARLEKVYISVAGGNRAFLESKGSDRDKAAPEHRPPNEAPSLECFAPATLDQDGKLEKVGLIDKAATEHRPPNEASSLECFASTKLDQNGMLEKVGLIDKEVTEHRPPNKASSLECFASTKLDQNGKLEKVGLVDEAVTEHRPPNKASSLECFAPAKLDQNGKPEKVGLIDKAVTEHRPPNESPSLECFAPAKLDQNSKPEKAGLVDKAATEHRPPNKSLSLECFAPATLDQDGIHEIRMLEDKIEDIGPMGALYSAFVENAEVSWLVVACDMPGINEEAVDFLLESYDPECEITCFQTEGKRKRDPLFAIYSSAIEMKVKEQVCKNEYSMQRLLDRSSLLLLDAKKDWLLNINTLEEYKEYTKNSGLDEKD